MTPITVKIIYKGMVDDVIRQGLNIARVFIPNNSYIDTPIYTEGYANPTVGDKQPYGRSIYATNTDDFRAYPLEHSIVSLTGKIAEFERAVLAAEAAATAKTENVGITFSVDTYEDELYWIQTAKNMVDLGFYTEVGTEKFGVAPVAPTAPETGV